MHYSEIPTLGIGLAADVAGAMPNFRNFLGAVEDPIDYLSFGAHHVQKARIAHYVDDLIQSDLPMVFHPINLNVAIEDAEDESTLRKIVEIAEYSNAVWAGQDVGVWSYDGQYLGAYLIPAIFDEESVREATRKTLLLNQELPCPFLIENPPVSFSLETMHKLDFMRLVSEEADCGIVLDVGHLIGYQQATGRAMDDMPLDRFPFHRVVEIHMAGLQFSQIGNDLNIIDQHYSPVHDLCWEFLDKYADQMSNLKGITLEQEYCKDELVRVHLRKAREIASHRNLFG